MQITNLAPGAGKTTSALALCTNIIKSSPKNYVSYITITNSAVGDATDKIKKKKELNNVELDRFHLGTMHSYLLILIRASAKDVKFIPSTLTYDLSIFSEILTTKDINNKDAFMTAFNATYPLDTKEKSRVIPMDLLLDYVLATGVKPKSYEHLVVDEFQDMYAREVNALAGLFSSNKVFMFGDTNQSIFSFRKTQDDDESVHVSTPQISTSQTYRLHQDSCDMLNRFLLLKKEFSLALGGEGKGIVKMTSMKKGTDDASVSILPTEALYYNGVPNLFKSGSKIEMEYPDEFINSVGKTKSFIIMHPFNSGAKLHSKKAIETFGKDSIYSWYEQVGNSRMYKDLRYLLTGQEGILNLNEVHRIMTDTLRKVGYGVPSGAYSKLEKIVNARRRTTRVHDDKVSMAAFTERMNIISNNELPLSYRISKTANTKSNFTANLTILSMLLNKGLQSYFNAVRLYFDKDKVKGQYAGGIFTVHAAKGMEAGSVMMDMTSGIHLSGGTYAAVEQTLNTIYVGLSRHVEKMFIISNYSALKRAPLPKENTFMKEYYDLLIGTATRKPYDSSLRQERLSELLADLSEHMMDSRADRDAFKGSNELVSELIFAACDHGETQKVLASLRTI